VARLVDFVALARPRHWIKNVFVLMPLPHALAGGGVLDPGSFAAGLAGFALASSAVYTFNDCRDAARDRLHPNKRDRPVAAGRITPGVGVIFGLLLLATGLLLVRSTGYPAALELTLLYVTINLFYSFWARGVPLLDVFLLASGFVLRVMLGCALVGAVASNWLLLCSSTLALFMAFAKRRNDLLSGVDGSHRRSLDGYDIGFLEQAISLTAAMALMSYAIYCMESVVLREGREFATLPFVAFGILEYLRCVRGSDVGGSPVDLALRSRTLQASGVGWVLATLWSIHWPT
jgi:4-hydroxybenzoate polyprenyltransferase